MALRHKWLDEAQTEFDETIDYVFCEFGERVAEGVYAEAKGCAQRLTQFPEMGMRYKDLLFKGNEVRIFRMREPSIIYCHDNETIFVLSFWNNRRDDSRIEEVLAERE